MKQQRYFIGDVHIALCFLGKLLSIVKSCLFALYCMSCYGCELWDFTCDASLHSMEKRFP